MEKKIQYVEDLLIKREKVFSGGSYNLLIHSVLNTINLNKLVLYYLTLHDSTLKRSIESNIYKRFELVKRPKVQYENLVKILENADYRKRQKLRKLQFALLPRLNKLYYQDFFNTYYFSNYINDISAALKICDKVWDDSLNELILKDYLNTGYELLLKLFLDYGNLNQLLLHIDKIWQWNPSNYLKIKIVRKVSPKNIDKLSFLRHEEPEKYLLGLSISEKKISDEIITDCFNDITSDMIPYGLLSLSKLKKWDLIEKEIIKHI